MYNVPPHHTPATIGYIAALVMATVIFLAFALALPGEHVGGDTTLLPQQAPAGLGL